MERSPGSPASLTSPKRLVPAETNAQKVAALPRHVQLGRDSRPSGSWTHSPGHAVSPANVDIPSRSGESIGSLNNGYNEQSPLLPPSRNEDVEPLPYLNDVLSPSSEPTWEDGEGSQETKSSWYLLLLTISICGLQIAWSVELSNGSPYLLGLGISKSLLAIVWIAGPLSGTLVQPYVGIRSDRCRSRFGKRRPFMVGGAIATSLSLVALAWARELVGGILAIFGVARDGRGTQVSTIVFAVIMVYVLDFSINVIQAAIRAFIVDNAPTHQQDSANAWASRVSGVGNIIGYIFAYVDLPKYFGFIGNTQFKVLCIIASVAMLGTLAISCFSIKERDPRLEGEPAHQEGGVLSFFRDLFLSMRKLPQQIKRVCAVQFFAWIGWFPFLFYITTYVGEIYVDPIFAEHPNLSPEDVDAAWERATRQGTFSLLIFALTTFASSVFLPFLIVTSYQPPEPPPRTPMTPGAKAPRTPPSLLAPAASGAAAATGYFSYNPVPDEELSTSDPVKPPTQNPIRRMIARLPSPEIRWLTLRRAWLLSHIAFFVLTWATFLVRDTTAATVLVALIGVPWAMTNWAPFALIAAEISKRDGIRRGVLRPPPTHDGELLARGEDPAGGSDQAGVVLGIHNVAIAAPQVIATLVSSVIFKWLQKPRGSTGDDSVAWVLRFGGLATLVAAYLTRRVHEEGRT